MGRWEPDLAAPDPAPLILTLRFDAERQALFDRLRAAHFPPQRNVLAAHVTLFHALPGAALDCVAARLADDARSTTPVTVAIGPPYSLGGGVAYRLISPAAAAFRERLARDWRDRLTRQDRSWSGLHVTVQNKVTPAEARTLLALLASGDAMGSFVSPGVDLWRYRGGPWEHAASFAFRRDPSVRTD